MHIILNHSSMVPIYEQLMEQIKSEIINTALKEGEALPSVRSLAGELRISALTVKKAYDKLEEEGFVTTIHGKGTYVTASDKQLALEARQREAEADFEKAIDRALAMGMSREDILETVTLLLEEIREFLAFDPKIDGGATILSCGDLAVRIFGLRAQRLQQMAEKIKSAYDKFL